MASSVLSIFSTPTATLTFSDIDSDAAAAILHRAVPRRSNNNRTSSHPPTPGTRRFRRYLNALVSADEGDGSSTDYYSASEVERDEGEPEVWRSEWRGEFVLAGEEFFDGRVGAPRRERVEKGSRLQRKVKTIERERMERRRERRERQERKQRRLAAAEQLAASSSSAHASTATTDEGSLAALRAQRDGVRVDVDEYVMVESETDTKEAADDDDEQDHQQQLEDELTGTSIIAGDALSHELWRCIDQPTRKLLRHMDDFAFLHALEQLLLAFKAHTQTRNIGPFQPPQLPSSTGRFFTALPSPLAGEVALHVPDAFLRHLLYGVLSWHVMYSAGRVGGVSSGSRQSRAGSRGVEDVGVVCVRMQRGYVYHECRLERYIQQHYGSGRH